MRVKLTNLASVKQPVCADRIPDEFLHNLDEALKTFHLEVVHIDNNDDDHAFIMIDHRLTMKQLPPIPEPEIIPEPVRPSKGDGLDVFRIRFSDGRYAGAGMTRNKRGKAFIGKAHLHSHISTYTYWMEKANGGHRSKFTTWPSQIPEFVNRFNGALLVNETTGGETPMLDYLDAYYQKHKRAK